MFWEKAFAPTGRRSACNTKTQGGSLGCLLLPPWGVAGCSLLFGQTTSPSSSVANEGFAPLCGAAAIPMAALKTPVASEGG